VDWAKRKSRDPQPVTRRRFGRTDGRGRCWLRWNCLVLGQMLLLLLLLLLIRRLVVVPRHGLPSWPPPNHEKSKLSLISSLAASQLALPLKTFKKNPRQ
jgi:hypothetical protein